MPDLLAETDQSLRARKRARTRATIAQTALELFSERGYDRVTLAEVARAADVGERTVFRYFRDKEELMFAEDDAVREVLQGALANRPIDEPPAVSLVEALVALAPRWQERLDEGRTRQRVIAGTASLQARERGKHNIYEQALAAQLIARGLEPEPARLLARAGIACQHEATLLWFDDPDPYQPGLEQRCRQALTQLATVLAPLQQHTRRPPR